jgi:predicted nucleic acid-binding protein
VTAAKAVFDASVLVRAALDSHDAARDVVKAAEAGALTAAAPDLVYAEATSAIVKAVRAGNVTPIDGAAVLSAIIDVPMTIVATGSLAPAALDVALRNALSAYDACYVALAEALDATLVTADRRLAAAASKAELIA